LNRRQFTITAWLAAIASGCASRLQKIVEQVTRPPMANSFIQGNATTSAITGSVYSLAFSSNVTAGNLLIVTWRRATTNAVQIVSDNMNAGNKWSIVYDTADASASAGGWAWCIAKASGACTVSVTLNGSTAGGVLTVGEWNGSSGLRAASAATVTATNGTITSPAITTVAGDLLIGIAESGTGVANYTAGSGYTRREQGQDTALTYNAIEDNLSSAGGSTTASFSVAVTGGKTIGIGAFIPGLAILGNCGAANATITYSGTSSGSVTSDGAGNYSIPGLSSGTYTVTPSLSGYTFSPTSYSATISVTAIQNFAATFSGSNPSVSDNFASGSLAAGWTHPSGAGWTTFPTVSGSPFRATPPNTSTGGNAIWGSIPWPKDQTASLVIKTVAVTGDIALMLRWQSGSPSGYFAQISAGANGINIIRYDNGTSTSLVATTVTPAIGDVWTFQIAGSCLSLYQNFKLILYTYDPNYISGTPGFSVFDSTSTNNSNVASWAASGVIQQDGIWSKQGIIIPANSNDLSSTAARGTQNPCILYDSNPQLITGDASGNVYKMWFAGAHLVGYAESIDGLTWTRRDGYVNTSVGTTPCVVKVSGTYHLYDQSIFGANVQHWTSSDGIAWSLQSNNVFPSASGLCYFSVVAIIGGTWYALYTLATGTFPSTLNLATSSDGVSWTAYGSNPVASNFWGVIKVNLINGIYYAWGQMTNAHAQEVTRPGIDPGEGLRMQTTDFIHWTNPVKSAHHSEIFENVNGVTGGCYVSYPLDIGGRALLYYSAGPDDAILTANSTLQIGVAIGPAPIASIITANEDAVVPVAVDTFQRADGTFSGNWTTFSNYAALQIASHLVEPTANNPTQCAAYYSAVVFSNDQYSEITIATLNDSAAQAAAAVRMSGNNAYFAQMQGATGNLRFIQIWKLVSGSGTQLSASIPVTPTIGDVLRLTAVGSAISVFQNGFLIGQVIDSSLASGSPGMILASNFGVTQTQVSAWAGGTAGSIPSYSSSGGSGGFGGGGLSQGKGFSFRFKR